MDNNAIVGKVLLACGCLHDIAEKSKEEITATQIKRVQENLEKLLNTHFPVTMSTLTIQKQQ